MDFKQIGLKIFKGALYGALASVTALQFAGVTGLTQLGKALLGAAVAGGLHGAHDAVKQVAGK